MIIIIGRLFAVCARVWRVTLCIRRLSSIFIFHMQQWPRFVYAISRCAIEADLSIDLYYKNQNWLQFLFIVKAAVLKQQILKFYPQIQRTEASYHIYFSQRPFINVKAIFCA